VGARCVAPHIRKIKILCDENALRGLRSVSDIGVDTAIQPLRINRIDLVTKPSENRD
jgi:hypothetical protein